MLECKEKEALQKELARHTTFKNMQYSLQLGGSRHFNYNSTARNRLYNNEDRRKQIMKCDITTATPSSPASHQRSAQVIPEARKRPDVRFTEDASVADSCFNCVDNNSFYHFLVNRENVQLIPDLAPVDSQPPCYTSMHESVKLQRRRPRRLAKSPYLSSSQKLCWATPWRSKSAITVDKSPPKSSLILLACSLWHIPKRRNVSYWEY